MHFLPSYFERPQARPRGARHREWHFSMLARELAGLAGLLALLTTLSYLTALGVARLH